MRPGERELLIEFASPFITVYPDEGRQRWMARETAAWWRRRNGNSIQIGQSEATLRSESGGGYDEPGDVRRVECGDRPGEAAGAGDAEARAEHLAEAAGATAMTETYQTMATEIIDGLTAERDAARALACFYHESLRAIAALGRDNPGLAVLAAARAEFGWLKAGDGR